MCGCTRRWAAAGNSPAVARACHPNRPQPPPNPMVMTSPEKNTPAASPSTAADDLQTLLGGGEPRRWWQRSTLWLGVAALALAGGGIIYWQSHQRASAAPVYVTEEVRRGNLTLNVSANGTLQPTRAVTIGSELSGTVKNVLVEVKEKIKKGQ